MLIFDTHAAILIISCSNHRRFFKRHVWSIFNGPALYWLYLRRWYNFDVVMLNSQKSVQQNT